MPSGYYFMNKPNRKIRVTAVSYLNTKPLLYGLLGSPVAEQIDLQLDIPSRCAAKLESGEADVGLVPVAIIPQLNQPRIISDYCIGTVGAVKTVAIFADQPLAKLERIYLDFHSRTSVELARILLEEHWNLHPELIPAREGFKDHIGGTTGAVVIGDRTIGLEKKHPFVYDLGQAWMDFTGLPFVFAAWVSNQDLPAKFLRAFNEALESGVKRVPELMYILPSPDPSFDLEEYYTRHISYRLDYSKRMALTRFLQYLQPTLQPSLLDSLATVSPGD